MLDPSIQYELAVAAKSVSVTSASIVTVEGIELGTAFSKFRELSMALAAASKLFFICVSATPLLQAPNEIMLIVAIMAITLMTTISSTIVNAFRLCLVPVIPLLANKV